MKIYTHEELYRECKAPRSPDMTAKMRVAYNRVTVAMEAGDEREADRAWRHFCGLVQEDREPAFRSKIIVTAAKSAA